MQKSISITLGYRKPFTATIPKPNKGKGKLTAQDFKTYLQKIIKNFRRKMTENKNDNLWERTNIHII